MLISVTDIMLPILTIFASHNLYIFPKLLRLISTKRKYLAFVADQKGLNL